MTEKLTHNPEHLPLEEWRVDTVTTYALGEHIDQCSVDLGTAVKHLIEYGLLARDLRDSGLVIKEVYPDGMPNMYVANEEVYDDIENVGRVISELDPRLGEYLKEVAKQRKLSADAAFSSLVEDARNFLMPFWKGARVFATNREGLMLELKGPDRKS